MAPLSISSDAIQEKNKLDSSGAWLLLVEFVYPNEEPVRVVWNTENVTWDGETWYAMPFQLGDIEESNEAEVPEVSLSIIDIERRLTPILDKYSGAVGATVWVRVVHSQHLDNTTPEFEMDFEVIDTSLDYQNTIKFKLGAENLSNERSPVNRFLKGHCRYKEFKGTLCGYSGSETDCSRTFERCRELGNEKRFGGFPGLGRLGYWR